MVTVALSRNLCRITRVVTIQPKTSALLFQMLVQLLLLVGATSERCPRLPSKRKERGSSGGGFTTFLDGDMGPSSGTSFTRRSMAVLDI